MGNQRNKKSSDETIIYILSDLVIAGIADGSSQISYYGFGKHTRVKPHYLDL